MVKNLLKLCAVFLSFIATPLCAEGRMAKANGIDIWYETFGDKQDPALLLIMGGCCQGIMWPTEFCERLANENFYVIRYDHRDTGFSTCFDFEKEPYDLNDMAKDAVGLLDALDVDRAHLVGLSMGGPIAEIMATRFSQRVHTISLIATSCEFQPMNLGYSKLPPEPGSLSRTRQVYLEWMKEFLARPPKNQEEALEQRVVCWRILNGSLVPFEEEFYRELHGQFLARSKNPEAIKNHISVCQNSEKIVRTVPPLVKVPTVVIHGSEDPIFPPDHGKALAAAIPGSKYVPVKGMGHVPNRHFYDLWVQEIKQNAARSN